MCNGVITSVIIYFLTIYCVLNQAFRSDGQMVDWEILGVTMYTCVVWTVNCQMALSINYFTWSNIFSYGAVLFPGMCSCLFMAISHQPYPQQLTRFLWKLVLQVYSIGLLLFSSLCALFFLISLIGLSRLGFYHFTMILFRKGK